MSKPAYCEVRESPGRALGLYATVDIHAGTRILAEAPLMIISQGHYQKGDAEAAFAKLSEESKAAFMSLASAHGQDPSIWPSRIHDSVEPKEKQRIQDQHDARVGPQKSILSIMMTNAMPWGADHEGSAVFATACRCNHSCVPNAYFSWNQAIERETIHAVRSIKAGEEITLAYCDPLNDEAIRRRALQHYGFVCICPACYHPEDENGGTDSDCFAAASKERKYRLREIDQALGRGLYWHCDDSAMVDEDHQIKLLLEEMSLLKAEGLVKPSLSNSAFQLAELCLKKGDYAFALKAARMGYRTIVTCVGEDAPLTKEKLAQLKQVEANSSKSIAMR